MSSISNCKVKPFQWKVNASLNRHLSIKWYINTVAISLPADNSTGTMWLEREREREREEEEGDRERESERERET